MKAKWLLVAGGDRAEIKTLARFDGQAGALDAHFDLVVVLALGKILRNERKRIFVARLFGDVRIEPFEIGRASCRERVSNCV